jgi:hypothetical protein
MITRSRPRVKPTRVSPRPPARFGVGLLGSTPTTRLSVPLSDMEWHEMMSNVYADEIWSDEVSLDQMAAEAHAIEHLESGLIPDDLATAIERRSLVGHRP